jgi:hypothetical protein
MNWAALKYVNTEALRFRGAEVRIANDRLVDLRAQDKKTGARAVRLVGQLSCSANISVTA